MQEGTFTGKWVLRDGLFDGFCGFMKGNLRRANAFTMLRATGGAILKRFLDGNLPDYPIVGPFFSR